MIGYWAGSIASIPSGWGLCDGTNDTPNLLNNKIVGSGDTYAVDDTGGSVNGNHDFTADGHKHDIQANAGFDFLVGVDNETTTDPIIGTTDNADELSPFHALLPIMRLN